mmetsp:Transcript_76773/g.230372  ORF Transcript_76773/g.230372 Transcript_76773/m.230372 type:complete len:407 (-) Transcript_76773:4-1224(-)
MGRQGTERQERPHGRVWSVKYLCHLKTTIVRFVAADDGRVAKVQSQAVFAGRLGRDEDEFGLHQRRGEVLDHDGLGGHEGVGRSLGLEALHVAPVGFVNTLRVCALRQLCALLVRVASDHVDVDRDLLTGQDRRGAGLGGTAPCLDADAGEARARLLEDFAHPFEAVRVLIRPQLVAEPRAEVRDCDRGLHPLVLQRHHRLTADQELRRDRVDQPGLNVRPRVQLDLVLAKLVLVHDPVNEQRVPPDCRIAPLARRVLPVRIQLRRSHGARRLQARLWCIRLHQRRPLGQHQRALGEGAVRDERRLERVQRLRHEVLAEGVEGGRGGEGHYELVRRQRPVRLVRRRQHRLADCADIGHRRRDRLGLLAQLWRHLREELVLLCLCHLLARSGHARYLAHALHCGKCK